MSEIYSLYLYLKFLALTLMVTSCFQATSTSEGTTRSLQKASIATTALATDENKATAGVDFNSLTVQTIDAPTQGALTGTSIRIQPGTFSLSSTLVIESGVALSETSVVNEVGLGSDIKVTSTSLAVIIRPTENVEIKSPLRISLPLPARALLHLSGITYAVYFKYYDPKTDRLMTGIFTEDNINTFVRFDSALQRDVIDFKGYFGSYWVVELSRPVLTAEIPIIKETKEAIGVARIKWSLFLSCRRLFRQDFKIDWT